MVRNEREFSKLVYDAQAYRQQGRALQEQMGSIQLATNEINAVIESIKNLDRMKKNEILLNMGSGVYAGAKVTDCEKVLVNVGAGIMIRKTAPDAIVFLEARKAELDKGMVDVRKAMDGTYNRIAFVEGEIRRIVEKGSDVQSP
ncbi:MAG: prefoldin subunit alpha [Candidatus Micrarchaeota archaeon]|nr:prefoldin subunit alpha [Candidatus Micrarchaeota archaeon]